ncbi:MAG: hypothetical protein COT14_00485 [Candidatus Diapherotrites archaeon CG08_land_8_20_14_0_20_30_16]|nr:MAG: hypothetical protein COT14_00485 [Candidatus Diapherotrites archaeon CG08_land_8_20_14_0_20_30_16]
MISNFESIKSLFVELDKNVESKINVYMLGGGALLFYGSKPETKDIDLVCDANDYFKLYFALKRIGFIAKNPSRGYLRLNIAEILVRDDFRIDLFNNKVCGNLSLSDTIKTRSKLAIDLKNLKLYCFSPEDIFVFKSITERDGDILDSEKIIQIGIDWSIIYSEILSQIKEHDKEAWVTYFVGRLEALIDKGFDIPIYKDSRKLAEEYYDQLESRITKLKKQKRM